MDLDRPRQCRGLRRLDRRLVGALRVRRARHQHPPGRRINSGLGGGPECKEAHGQANWKMRVQLPARTPAGRATHLLERPQVLARQVRKALQSARQGGETPGNAGVQTGWLSSYGQNRLSRQPQLSHRRRRRPSAHRRSARTRTACTRAAEAATAAGGVESSISTLRRGRRQLQHFTQLGGNTRWPPPLMPCPSARSNTTRRRAAGNVAEDSMCGYGMSMMTIDHRD